MNLLSKHGVWVTLTLGSWMTNANNGREHAKSSNCRLTIKIGWGKVARQTIRNVEGNLPSPSPVVPL